MMMFCMCTVKICVFRIYFCWWASTEGLSGESCLAINVIIIIIIITARTANNKKLSYRRETARQLCTSFSARSLIMHFTGHHICCTCSVQLYDRLAKLVSTQPGNKPCNIRGRWSFQTLYAFPMFPLEFPGEVNHEETRVTGLSYSEDRMIIAWVVLTQCQHVTDGQTDRFTIASTALCVANYADAL